jgi:WD40 repeat protein
MTAHAAPPPDDLWTQNAGDPVLMVDFSPDGSLVASGTRDLIEGEPAAQLWNASDGSFVQEFPGYTYGLLGLEFSPAGTYLAVGSIRFDGLYFFSGRTALWNYETGQQIDSFFGCYNGFSADGAYLMSAGGPQINDVRVQRVSDGTEIANIDPGVVIEAAAISPDGDFVAVGSSGGSVSIWRVANESLVHSLTHDSSTVRELAYSPDAALLASAGLSSQIKLWDTATGQLVRTLDHGGWVTSLDFTCNGAFMLSTGHTNAVGQTVRFWEVATGELLATRVTGIPPVQGAAWSPDGSTFVYGLSDGTVALAVSPVSVSAPGDVNGDGLVDMLDLLQVLADWGDCPPPPVECPSDVNGDGVVDFLDLLLVLANWSV